MNENWKLTEGQLQELINRPVDPHEAEIQIADHNLENQGCLVEGRVVRSIEEYDIIVENL